MQITSATLQPIQLKATYMNITQYSPPSNPTGLKKLFSKFSAPNPTISLSSSTSAVAFLRVATCTTKILVSREFAQDFLRAQKKPPPSTTRLSVLVVSKAEYDASTAEDPVFAGVIPRRQGRVYIGFGTHQTTGFGGHVGVQALVPTVERESIDFADGILRVWNGELLSSVGIFTRSLTPESDTDR
jgi:Protein of unknown function (DUF3684)